MALRILQSLTASQVTSTMYILFVQDICHDSQITKALASSPPLNINYLASQGGQRGNEGVLRMQDLRESGLLIRRVRRL